MINLLLSFASLIFLCLLFLYPCQIRKLVSACLGYKWADGDPNLSRDLGLSSYFIRHSSGWLSLGLYCQIQSGWIWSVYWFNAHLATKGFYHTYNVDYFKANPFVTRLNSIRILLSCCQFGVVHVSVGCQNCFPLKLSIWGISYGAIFWIFCLGRIWFANLRKLFID